MPTVPELTVSVEVIFPPDVKVVLAGFRDAVRPLDGNDAREMVPENPPREVMVIVDVPETPGVMLTVAGLAVIEKSGMLKFTVAECERLPLIPVTVTL